MRDSTPPFRLSVWYAQSYLRELVLIYPTYLIMMEESGIGALGLASLMMIWSATTFLFEVPSGILGDLCKRRSVLVVAGLIHATAFACWLLWPGFWGFALGFTIWSLGSSLYSGTAEAFLYESLTEPATQDFARCYGRTEAAAGAGAATALFLGGYIAQGGYTLPLLLSLLAPGLASLLLLLLPHSSSAQLEDKQSGFFTVLKSGTSHIVGSPHVGLIILVVASLAAIPGVFEEYIGVMLVERQFDLAQVGMVYGAVWSARTVGNLYAHRIATESLRSALGWYLAGSIAFFAMVFVNPLFFLIALLVYYAMDGAFDVLLTSRLQHAVEDDHRATVTSVMSMAVEVFALLYFLGIAAAANLYSWSFALYLSVAVGVCLALFWLWQVTRLQRNN